MAGCYLKNRQLTKVPALIIGSIEAINFLILKPEGPLSYTRVVRFKSSCDIETQAALKNQVSGVPKINPTHSLSVSGAT
jgi:hypothetical protein